MHASRPLFRLLCAAALLLAGSAASAPATTGTISAKAIDPRGQVLPGVLITLQTSGPQVQLTSAAGQALFSGVAPGRYAMDAELQGFAAAREEVLVHGGKIEVIVFTLKPAFIETLQSDESIPSDR